MSDTSQTSSPVSKLPALRVLILAFIGLFIFVGAVASVGGILYVHYKANHVIAEEDEEDDAPPEESAHPSELFAISYQIQKMGIALATRRGDAGGFAQFTLVFDCPTDETKRTLEVSRSMVRDAVYEAAADFRIEQFNNADGFAQFRERILEVLRDRLKDAAPRAVALEEWTIQPAQ